MGHFALAAGLGVEAFASAAVGMSAGLALTRGLIRCRTDRIGNFWVDLVRSITRILLPLSLLFAIAFVALGVIQNIEGTHATVTPPRRRPAANPGRSGWIVGAHQADVR
jgi:K+-transporting ATPase ATPase A chain